MKLNDSIKFFLLFLLIFTILIIKNTFFQNNNYIIKYQKNYNLKIDYPNTNNPKINIQTKNFINKKKKEFFELIKSSSNKKEYNFTATYSITTINEIESLQLIIHYNSTENTYKKEIKNYHYNKKTNEPIFLNYFLYNQKEKEYFNEIINYHITKYFNENHITIYKDIYNINLEKYQQFYFNEYGLNIIIFNYTNNEDLTINIPYNNLQTILNSKYFSKSQPVSNPKETTRNLEQFKNKKLIAFTFDDGPNKTTTNKLLDNLNKYNARVTFFVLGSRINDCPECIEKAYKMGNQIGNHTYSHANLFYLKDEDIITEIETTNNELEKITGHNPTLLRPPYGNTNTHIKNLTNMYTILWNIDTLDWKYKNKNKIKNEILKHAKDGAIILLHDIYNSSVEGALLAMKELEKENYAFVTIDEMTKIKNIELNLDKKYYEIKK